MSRVFTESMNKLDPQDTTRSFSVVENYIRYMTERIEFSITGVFKTASAAGASNAEVLQAVKTLRDTVSVLSSSVSLLQGEMKAAQASIVALQDKMAEAQASIVALQDDVRGLQSQTNE